MTVAKFIYGNNKPLLKKNSLRTIEAQLGKIIRNNEDRPKFTGSYKKKRVGALKYRMFINHDSRGQQTNYIKAPSTLCRINLKTQLYCYGYGFCPH